MIPSAVCKHSNKRFYDVTELIWLFSWQNLFCCKRVKHRFKAAAEFLFCSYRHRLIQISELTQRFSDRRLKHCICPSGEFLQDNFFHFLEIKSSPKLKLHLRLLRRLFPSIVSSLPPSPLLLFLTFPCCCRTVSDFVMVCVCVGGGDELFVPCSFESKTRGRLCFNHISRRPHLSCSPVV